MIKTRNRRHEPLILSKPTRAALPRRAALEAAGVEFLDGDEPGVKLRKAKGKRK
jgi:hypothetical protein